MTQDLSQISDAAQVATLLEQFHKSVDSVQQTILVGDDGLLVQAAKLAERAYADRLAAVVSGLRSVAEGGAQVLGNQGVRQVIVELHAGYFLVSRVAGGYDLGVNVDADADLGAVGYEVALLVERLGQVLTPEVAAELKSGLPD